MRTKLGRFGSTVLIPISAAVIGFTALAGYGTAASAKDDKSDQTPSADSTKKPGQTCEQFKKDFADYKKCVEGQAKEEEKDQGKKY